MYLLFVTSKWNNNNTSNVVGKRYTQSMTEKPNTKWYKHKRRFKRVSVSLFLLSHSVQLSCMSSSTWDVFIKMYGSCFLIKKSISFSILIHWLHFIAFASTFEKFKVLMRRHINKSKIKLYEINLQKKKIKKHALKHVSKF